MDTSAVIFSVAGNPITLGMGVAALTQFVKLLPDKFQTVAKGNPEGIRIFVILTALSANVLMHWMNTGSLGDVNTLVNTIASVFISAGTYDLVLRTKNPPAQA